jgi:hypothetical protein
VIAWDPRILWVDSLEDGIDGRESCYFQEPIHMATVDRFPRWDIL